MTPISTGNAFPRFRAAVGAIIELPWGASFSLNDDQSVVPISQAILRTQQDAASVGVPSLLSLSSLLIADLTDLIALAETEHDGRTLDFLRYLVCMAPMEATAAIGRRGDCSDWFVLSVSRDYNPANRVNHGYAFLPLYVEGDSQVGQLCLEFIERWTFHLYTIERVTGGLDEFAVRFEEFCWNFCKDIFESSWSERPLAALVAIIAWTQLRERKSVAAMAQRLREYWDRPEFPRSLRSVLATAFITGAAQYTDKSHQEWADLVLKDYADVLREHEKLQFLGVSIRTPQMWQEKRGEVIEEAARISFETQRIALEVASEVLVLLWPEPDARRVQ